MTNKQIIKEFRSGHKGEETMEVEEAKAEIQIALSQQKEKFKKLILETIGLEHKEVNAIKQSVDETKYRIGWNEARDKVEELREKILKEIDK